MATRAARGGEYWYSTDDVEYTIRHKEVPFSSNGPDYTHADFMAFSIDDEAPITIRCHLGDTRKHYQAQRRQFKARLSRRYPNVSRACAIRVTDSFMEIVHIANATHACMQCQHGSGSLPAMLPTVMHYVYVNVHPILHDGPYRCPATRASVVELLSKVFLETAEKECMICMEEMKMSKAIMMPCSHSFHQVCLVQWLDDSHVCPLCRYKLPKAEYRSLE